MYVLSVCVLVLSVCVLVCIETEPARAAAEVSRRLLESASPLSKLGGEG